MNEQWKAVAGFEGLYEVSDQGCVRNARSQRLLKPQPCTNKYMQVHLGAGNPRRVHRLVAEAFVPGDAALQVNHKNGNRADNRAENLDWLSCSDNHRHSYAHLERKPHAKTRAVNVGGVVYPSGLAAAKALGVVAGSIASALNKGHRCRGMEVAYG